MIKSLEINYENRNISGKFSYILETEETCRLLPEKIEFTDGLNVIVGTNGCGKTTILEILTHMCLSYGLKTDFNFWDAVSYFYPNANDLGDAKYKIVQDVINVENNYNCPVKRMDKLSVKKDRSGGNFQNFNDFAQFFVEKNLSKGQKMMNTLYNEIVRVQKEFEKYRYDNLFLKPNSVNDTWAKGSDKVREYVEKHNHPEIGRRCTFLMDEPDEGLDIFNLKELQGFLETASETCQIIVVLHNPLLISSLIGKANFIELTPNYIKTIQNF